MDEPCSPNSLPPFISKIYEMVDDQSTNSVVSWSCSNRSFIVWNPPEFSRDLLPKYFKHSNFSSFIRQLNTYGFRKTDPEQWEFANDDFVRGKPHLLKNIYRRKPVHSHSEQAAVVSRLSESETQRYKDDIERLKTDKEALLLELQRYKQEEQRYELQVVGMTETFQLLEQKQNNVISFLAKVVQKPMVNLELMPQPDIRERKRRIPGNNCLNEDVSMGNTQIISQNLHKEHLDASSLLAFNKDLLVQLDTTLSFWENLLINIGQACEGLTSSPALVESTSFTGSRLVSYTVPNANDVSFGPKTDDIDLNSERSSSTAIITETAISEEHIAINPTDVATGGPTGVNDVFWEQFLTETPGASNASEVHSERKAIEEPIILFFQASSSDAFVDLIVRGQSLCKLPSTISEYQYECRRVLVAGLQLLYLIASSHRLHQRGLDANRNMFHECALELKATVDRLSARASNYLMLYILEGIANSGLLEEQGGSLMKCQ